MDYNTWGQQYLEEAEYLHKRIDAARTDTALMPPEKAHRIGLLYSMYLECLVTGHELQRRGAAASCGEAAQHVS